MGSITNTKINQMKRSIKIDKPNCINDFKGSSGSIKFFFLFLQTDLLLITKVIYLIIIIKKRRFEACDSNGTVI